MAIKLPLRFRILYLMSTKKDSVKSEDIMKELENDYGKERQFKKKAMDNHLLSMRALGLIEISDVSIDKNDELVESYKISKSGIGRLKYLPKEYK